MHTYIHSYIHTYMYVRIHVVGSPDAHLSSAPHYLKIQTLYVSLNVLSLLVSIRIVVSLSLSFSIVSIRHK